MNKIRVIDLLNKIANGEDIPEKIRFDNQDWNRVYGEINVYYIGDDYGNDLFVYIFKMNVTFTINDEVEIIEEDNKIEKIENKIDTTFENYNYSERMRLTEIVNKINEIIDKLNEMSDK